VFLLLLCNDRAVLGPWINPTWLNALASLIIGVLVVRSAILTATTLFPSVNVTLLAAALFAALAAGLTAATIYVTRGKRTASATAGSRETWTMPPLDLLDRATWSRTRTIGMATLRGYLVIAVLMLIVKAIEVGAGH
jgi:hypothetical protein